MSCLVLRSTLPSITPLLSGANVEMDAFLLNEKTAFAGRPFLVLCGAPIVCLRQMSHPAAVATPLKGPMHVTNRHYLVQRHSCAR